MLNKHFQVATPNNFDIVVNQVLQLSSAINDHATVIALSGDLGAGKTTFTQQLAHHVGIIAPVASPTFGIMKSYELTNHPNYDQLVHIDAYRIESELEVGPLRLEEVFKTPRTLVCVEWPEKIKQFIPDVHIAVSIAIASGEMREVYVVSSAS